MHNLGKNILFFLVLTCFLASFLCAADKLGNGNWYSIKADNNMWLSYDKESGNFVLKGPEFRSKFKAIEKANNQFVFKLADREYFSASDNSTVTVRENPWSWETFTVEETPEQRYYLISVHGNYLRVNYHTHKLDLSPNREVWEAIEFVKEAPKLNNGEQFFIKSANGNFLLFDRDSKKIMSAQDNKKTAFKIIAKPDNKIVLEIAPGQFVSASNDSTVTVRENPWDWETFTPEEAPGGKLFLKSVHNNYLNFNPTNGLINLVNSPDFFAEFEFIPAVFEPLNDALIEALKEDRQQRLDFIASHNESKTWAMPCFGGNCLTKLSNSTVPRTAMLANYNSSAIPPYLVSCFPPSFLPYVPKEILEKLKEYKVAPENTTLCWNVQSSKGLGGNDSWGEGPALDINTTRLKAHGFAAPNAPENFSGDLVNRNFLFGIFAPDDASIADADVKINELKGFPVHVHDNGLSPPQMASIALTSKSPTQAFWSLIIDNNHPEGEPVQANITLHWVLSYKEQENNRRKWDTIHKNFAKLQKDKWQYLEPDKKDENLWYTRVHDMSFKEIVSDLKNNNEIKDSNIMQSLHKLLSDVWGDI